MHPVFRLRFGLLALAALGGCSDAGDHPGFAELSASADGRGTGGSSGYPGIALTVGARSGSGGAEAFRHCAAVEQAAKSTFRPIDVIFVVDNSSSMDDEIEQVQARINDDFAKIIENSGLDYRVVLISRYGKVKVPVGQSDNPICIGAPLGDNDCACAATEPLENSRRFFHYSADIESHDAWCVLLAAFDQPDEFGDSARKGWVPLAPHGYSQYLRPESFKVFVVITDDDVSCSTGSQAFRDGSAASGGEMAAADFDSALLELSPSQFGSAIKRNYVWHSIVGLAAPALARTAWPASAPIQTASCPSGSEGPGTGYQALSRLTGGLRYPSCSNRDFDAIFSTIARGIVDGAELNCEWQLPAPPAGESFDPALVNVRYTWGSGAAESLLQVSRASGCGASGGWYYDDPQHPSKVEVCPTTCERIRKDPQGRIDLLFGCKTETRIR